MSDPDRARRFNEAEARRLSATEQGGRVFSEPARALTLSFPLKGFPWMETAEGDEFEPDTLELTYEWWGEWLLMHVEVGGSDPRFSPYQYLCAVGADVSLPWWPDWVREFVPSVDPAKFS